MTDCLILGFNDTNFEDYVEMVRSMGSDAGAYRDLNLAFIQHEGRPYRSMDILNRYYFEDQPESRRRFHNADFLWPVVLYLGSYLHRAGFSFDYVNLPHLEKDKLRDKLLFGDVRTVAITTTLYVAPHPILELVSFIRKHNQRAKIIVGGPYVQNQLSMMGAKSLGRLLHYLGADYYIFSQEGEATLARLLRALKEGLDLDKVDNLAYRKGDGWVSTRSSPERNPLDENMVDYRLFPQEDLGELISLRTAKSCPFSCAFCGFPQRAGKYTYVGLDLIEQELETLAELGVTTLTFLDDTFNVPKKRFKEILRLMIDKRYGFRWNSFYRSDHGDDEAIELMAEAGCEGVFLGVESGSDEMLKQMNKSARRKHYLAAIPHLQSVGISCHTNLIIGFPGETHETVAETLDLVETARPDFYRAQLWYADPMTPIWQRKEECRIRGEAFNWSHDTMDSAEACDLVDKMFLAVENSTWLPQYGFEQWSTFYLQRQGMTLEQIKGFVRCFNAAIKEKLIHPRQREPSPEVMASLAASCMFDRDGAESDMAPVTRLSGAAYRAAERFWSRELDSVPAVGNLDLDPGGEPEPAGPAGWFRLEMEAATAEALSAREKGLPATQLAAFAALLSRLSGREDTVVLSCFDEGDGALPVPLRLHTDWELPFGAFAERVSEKARRVAEHRRCALAITANPWRMAGLGTSSPVLDVGFHVRSTPGVQPAAELERTLAFHPQVHRGLMLTLSVAAGAPGTDIGFVYNRGRLRPQTLELLAACQSRVFDAVARDPEVRLGDIELALGRSETQRAVEADAMESFSF